MSDFLPDAISGVVVASPEGAAFRIEPGTTPSDADEFLFFGPQDAPAAVDSGNQVPLSEFLQETLQMAKSLPLPEFHDVFEFIEGAYLEDFVA